MHLIKHAEDFEKYLHYMVGQTQAEACVTDKATQQYFKVFTNCFSLHNVLFCVFSYFIFFFAALLFVGVNRIG